MTTFDKDTVRQFYREICRKDIEAVAEEQAKRDHRTYYGASALGKRCDREMFFYYRKAAEPLDPNIMTNAEIEVEGAKMRLFDRGHLEEDRFIKRITPFFENVYPVDPETGKQFEIVNCEGMHKGHSDGEADRFILNGITFDDSYLLEFKTHNESSFDKLAGKKRPDGTRPWKTSIQKAKSDHYAQIQDYLFHRPHLKGCFYFAVCKNNDDWYIEFVERNTESAVAELERVSKTIWADQAPPKMSGASHTNFYCAYFCDFKAQCFGDKPLRKTCRTCYAFSVCGSQNICGEEVKSLDDGDMTPCSKYRSMVI